MLVLVELTGGYIGLCGARYRYYLNEIPFFTFSNSEKKVDM